MEIENSIFHVLFAVKHLIGNCKMSLYCFCFLPGCGFCLYLNTVAANSWLIRVGVLHHFSKVERWNDVTENLYCHFSFLLLLFHNQAINTSCADLYGYGKLSCILQRMRE